MLTNKQGSATFDVTLGAVGAGSEPFSLAFDGTNTRVTNLDTFTVGMQPVG